MLVSACGGGARAQGGRRQGRLLVDRPRRVRSCSRHSLNSRMRAGSGTQGYDRVCAHNVGATSLAHVVQAKSADIRAESWSQ